MGGVGLGRASLPGRAVSGSGSVAPPPPQVPRRALRGTTYDDEDDDRIFAGDGVDAFERSRAAEADRAAEHHYRESLRRPPSASASSSTSASAPASPAVPPSSFSSFRPFGLRNCGNSCYLNATLQCLVHTPRLHAGWGQPGSGADGSRRRVVATAMRALAEAGASSGTPHGLSAVTSAIKAEAAALSAQFNGDGQNDSHEFLRCVLLALHNELNKVKGTYKEMGDEKGETDEQAGERWWRYHRSHDDSLVYDLFGGQLKTVTLCGACRTRSKTFDPFLDLSLAMPRAGVGASSFGSSHTLESLLDLFSAIEPLGGRDKFKCGQCKTPQDAQRQTTIVRFPETLVVHLKRFNSVGVKNSAEVDYPAVLEVRPLWAGVAPDDRRALPKYALFGVVCHTGSYHFGHYTALVRVQVEEWVRCDDSFVGRVSSREALGERVSAYVLFYTRVS